MAQIKLEIRNCSECPNFKATHIPTADSFEMVEKWTCIKSNKVIAPFYENFDKTPSIPEWCPINAK